MKLFSKIFFIACAFAAIANSDDLSAMKRKTDSTKSNTSTSISSSESNEEGSSQGSNKKGSNKKTKTSSYKPTQEAVVPLSEISNENIQNPNLDGTEMKIELVPVKLEQQISEVPKNQYKITKTEKSETIEIDVDDEIESQIIQQNQNNMDLEQTAEKEKVVDEVDKLAAEQKALDEVRAEQEKAEKESAEKLATEQRALDEVLAQHEKANKTLAEQKAIEKPLAKKRADEQEDFKEFVDENANQQIRPVDRKIFRAPKKANDSNILSDAVSMLTNNTKEAGVICIGGILYIAGPYLLNPEVAIMAQASSLLALGGAVVGKVGHSAYRYFYPIKSDEDIRQDKIIALNNEIFQLTREIEELDTKLTESTESYNQCLFESSNLIQSRKNSLGSTVLDTNVNSQLLLKKQGASDQELRDLFQKIDQQRVNLTIQKIALLDKIYELNVINKNAELNNLVSEPEKHRDCGNALAEIKAGYIHKREVAIKEFSSIQKRILDAELACNEARSEAIKK